MLIADKLARRVQRSVNVTKHGIIPYARYGFLLACYRNSAPKTHHFLDTQLQKCRDLETQIRGSVKIIGNVTIR